MRSISFRVPAVTEGVTLSCSGKRFAITASFRKFVLTKALADTNSFLLVSAKTFETMKRLYDAGSVTP
ncbi:MAG: hypothetical protein J6M53_05495, partial [Bacteroidaceae bacterium]|nr:hypothetical protein [Bacteroidaceae bacterium]